MKRTELIERLKEHLTEAHLVLGSIIDNLTVNEENAINNLFYLNGNMQHIVLAGARLLDGNYNDADDYLNNVVW